MTTSDPHASIIKADEVANGHVPETRPTLLASIGTVLIDTFEISRPKADISAAPPPREPSSLPMTTSALPSQSPSQSTSRPSTGSSASSAARKRLSAVSGRSTPQRNFDSPAASPTDDVREILGGGAMYALVGARMWLDAKELRCVVDRASEEMGRDFPRKLEEQLNVFGDEIWCWNEGPGTKASRSRLKYEDGTRFFEYLQPPPHRTVAALAETPVFGSQCLHISPPYTPSDLKTILADLETVRDSKGRTWRPTVIYEPHPQHCEPSQRPALERAAPRIDILSPNHEELLAIYGQTCPPSASEETIHHLIEPLIDHLVDTVGIGKGGAGAVVVRCGRHGSCVGTRTGGIKWFPAYFTEEDIGRVVDVSGAGNSYLGGYAAGLHLSGGDPYQAALYGTVSASFMVEQIGLPVFHAGSGSWNEDRPKARLSALRNRIDMSGTIRTAENEREQM